MYSQRRLAVKHFLTWFKAQIPCIVVVEVKQRCVVTYLSDDYVMKS